MLGEIGATSVGVDVPRVRLRLVLASALVVGAAVAIAGPIGFVGLLVPHVIRLAVGPGASGAVAAGVHGGGLFLLLADLVARAPSRPARSPSGWSPPPIGAPGVPGPVAAPPRGRGGAVTTGPRRWSRWPAWASVTARAAVLRDVSFAVGPASWWRCAARTAPGKSTLLRLLLGLHAPAAGQVRLGGAPLDELTRREIARRAALLPQDAPADLPLTAREAVALGRLAHLDRFQPDSSADVEAVIARAGADRPGRLRRPPRRRAVGRRAAPGPSGARAGPGVAAAAAGRAGRRASTSPTSCRRWISCAPWPTAGGACWWRCTICRWRRVAAIG